MNSSQGQFGVSGDAPAGVRVCYPFHRFGGNFFSIFFNRGFARVSPVFAVALLSLSSAILAPDGFASNKSTGTNSASRESAGDPIAAKRQSASSQFARAEEQRAALSSKSAEKRTLADYKQVVNTYRHVYLITPHASEVPDALVAFGELYSEMGGRFGRSFFQWAVVTYQFLMREYPTSRYCQDAYLRSAKLQKDQLGDLSGASATYEAFLKKFPRSPHKREVQEARAELALLQNSAPVEAPRSAIARSAGSEAERPETQKRVISRDLPREAETETARIETRGANEQGAAPSINGHMPQIRKISAKSSQDSTRVTIELESAVQYASGRIANPDRIYFDLHAAKLMPQLAHGTIRTDGTILSGVRVAQNPSGIVRVVLDVNGVTDYSTSLLNNPSRLVIDLYSNGQAVQTAKAGDGDGDSGRVENAAVSTERPEAKTQTAPTGGGKSAKADTDDSLGTMPQPKKRLGTAKIGKSGGKAAGLVQP